MIHLLVYVLVQYLKQLHKKYLAHQLASNIEFKQLRSLKTLHCNDKLFFLYVSPPLYRLF